MSTTTDRAAELRQEIEGAFALSAANYAAGNYAAAANFTKQVNEARDELRQMEDS